MASKQEKVEHVQRAEQTRKHTCHWPGCPNQVPPAMWGCKQHWLMLPRHLREAIWISYEPGQEDDMSPSPAYLDVADAVQEWIENYEANHVKKIDESF